MSIGLVGCFDDRMHMFSSDTTVDMIYLDFSKDLYRLYLVSLY